MDAKLITNMASQLTDAELTEIAKITTSELRSRNSDPGGTTPSTRGGQG